jgi:hypothetical protein
MISFKLRALDILYLFEGFTVKMKLAPETAKQDQNKATCKNTIDKIKWDW